MSKKAALKKLGNMMALICLLLWALQALVIYKLNRDASQLVEIEGVLISSRAGYVVAEKLSPLIKIDYDSTVEFNLGENLAYDVVQEAIGTTDAPSTVKLTVPENVFSLRRKILPAFYAVEINSTKIRSNDDKKRSQRSDRILEASIALVATLATLILYYASAKSNS